MGFKKLAPWNWFKKEEEGAGSAVPARKRASRSSDNRVEHPISHSGKEMNRIFNKFFNGFGSETQSAIFAGWSDSPAHSAGFCYSLQMRIWKG